MAECTFLSTEEDKILCFDDCSFYKEERENCPFNNQVALKKAKSKDYSFDYVEEEEEPIISFPKIYSEEYD